MGEPDERVEEEQGSNQSAQSAPPEVSTADMGELVSQDRGEWGSREGPQASRPESGWPGGTGPGA